MNKQNSKEPKQIAMEFVIIIRVGDRYLKTKVIAKNIEEAERIIERTVVNYEYQIMNVYKAK